MEKQKHLSWLVFAFAAISVATLFIQTSYETLRHAKIERTRNLSVAIGSFQNSAYSSAKELAMPASSGSGIVFWRDGYILSAAHVIGKNAPRKIFIATIESSGKTFEGKILATDPTNDIVAIKINHKFFSEIPIGNNVLNPWEKIYSFSCLYGACGTYTEGNFIAYGKNIFTFTEDRNIILFNLFIAEGASGGGIFDKNGNLAATTLGGVALEQELPSATIGISAETIHQFLETNHLPHRHAPLF